jgi:hypothetical protein
MTFRSRRKRIEHERQKGKAMSVATADVGDLVLAALEAALEQEGECRLVTAGRMKGLLPGGPATAAKKRAKEQCLDPALGLFTVSQTTAGSKIDLVIITRRGIEFLIERRTPTQRRELLERSANPHKETVHEAVLRITTEELKRAQVERDVLDNRANELRQFVRKLTEEQLASLERTRTDLLRRQNELQALVDAATNAPSPRLVPPAPRHQFPQPVDDSDLDYQRDMCREMVFAWQDNPEPVARAALEVVMMNAGLERVGEVGDAVSFDNRYHHTESDLLPGQPAIVVEPGWQLISPRGTLHIARSEVRPATPQGVVHAAHA